MIQGNHLFSDIQYGLSLPNQLGYNLFNFLIFLLFLLELPVLLTGLELLELYQVK